MSNEQSKNAGRKIGFLANKNVTKRQSQVMGACALAWMGICGTIAYLAHIGIVH